MRIGRKATTGVGEFLTEAIHLRLGDPTLDEGSRVHAGGRVALEEELVRATGVVGSLEEVVEADLVQRRRTRVRGDVSSDGYAGTLRSVHHDGGVPPDHPADLSLHRLIPGEPGLALGGDGVDVVGAAQARHTDVAFCRSAQQREHHVTGAVVARGIDQCVEGVDPLAGLVRVDVHVLGRQAARQGSGRVALRGHRCSHPLSSDAPEGSPRGRVIGGEACVSAFSRMGAGNLHAPCRGESGGGSVAGTERLLGSWRAVAGELRGSCGGVAGELRGSIANELVGTACGRRGLSVD